MSSMYSPADAFPDDDFTYPRGQRTHHRKQSCHVQCQLSSQPGYQQASPRINQPYQSRFQAQQTRFQDQPHQARFQDQQTRFQAQPHQARFQGQRSRYFEQQEHRGMRSSYQAKSQYQDQRSQYQARSQYQDQRSQYQARSQYQDQRSQYQAKSQYPEQLGRSCYYQDRPQSRRGDQTSIYPSDYRPPKKVEACPQVFGKSGKFGKFCKLVEPSTRPKAKPGEDENRTEFAAKLREKIIAKDPEFPRMTTSWKFSQTQKKPETIDFAVRLADSTIVLEQYVKVLCNACHQPESTMGKFIAGHRDIARMNLEWVQKLLAPLGKNRVDEDTYVKLSCVRARHGPTELDASILKALQVICGQESVDFTADEFGLSYGLTVPLVVACGFMPTLNDWLPVEMHEQGAKFGQIVSQIGAASSPQDLQSALEQLTACIDWSTPAGMTISKTLDRICILLRVKSNATSGDFSLDKSLSAFPACFPDVHTIWTGLKHAVEEAFPPSLLLKDGCKRNGSWGYAKLTPVTDGLVTRFAEHKLGYVSDAGAAEAEACTPYNMVTNGTRLRDILMKTGEILISKEICMLMTRSRRVMEDLCSFTSSESDFDYNPVEAMVMLSTPEVYASEPKDVAMALNPGLSSCLPSLSQPTMTMHPLLFWRVDPPEKVVLYTGQSVNQDLEATPHSLPKVVLDERSIVGSMCRVMAVGSSDGASVTADSIGGLLRNEMHHEVRKAVQEKPVLMECLVNTDRCAPHTHTALWEGIYVMSGSAPLLHNVIKLNQSVPWEDRENQDERYAETQIATNGVRHRDWASVCLNKDTNARCRLESHAFPAYTPIYYTHIPWRKLDGSVEWVKVASTQPIGFRVMHEKKSRSHDVSLGSLMMSIRARFLMDKNNLLPAREGMEAIVDKVTTYQDADAKKIVLCYSTKSKQGTGDFLEFIAFERY